MSILRKDGTAHVRLIAPGRGSSGYYPRETLQRAAPAFKDALMFWDHQTKEEAAKRPEGSLSNLAGKVQGLPTYEESGPVGPGLYADVKVYEPFRAAVESMGTDIGVSIRAPGRSRPGMVEGQKVTVIEDIGPAVSVDWVTRPGAGGRAVELFEAARKGALEEGEISIKEATAVTETWTSQAFQEAQEADRKRIEELEERLRKADERDQLREAQDLIRREVMRAELPEQSRARVQDEVIRHIPLTEAGGIDEDKLVDTIRETVRREAAYVTSLTGGGRIRGMGAGSELGYTEDQVKASEARLEESFKRFGLPPEAAKIAAAGRR